MSWPSLLARTKDWGTEILTDTDLEGQFDIIIAYINAMMDSTSGHKHDGTTAEGPKIATGGISNDAITFALIDDDGDFGLFTGDWSFNEIALVEDTAPSTAASEMKLYTKDTSGQPELFVREESDGDEIQITSAGALKLSGSAIQVVNTQTGSVNTGTTLIPNDDSIPQNDEGDEYMTLAITPTNSSNTLLIDVVVACSPNAGGIATVALFQDSTAGALAAVQQDGSNDHIRVLSFRHKMSAGTTSETTFKIRAGQGSAGTFTFNGANEARKLGGVLASSITIMEIQA